jgi:hypothetical protein
VTSHSSYGESRNSDVNRYMVQPVLSLSLSIESSVISNKEIHCNMLLYVHTVCAH